MSFEFAFQLFLVSLIPIGLYIVVRLIYFFIDYRKFSINSRNKPLPLEVYKAKEKSDSFFELTINRILNFARKHHLI